MRVTDEVIPRQAWLGTAVNIGAGDGVGYDETASLFAAGFRGLAIEADEARFNVSLPKNLGPNVSTLFAEVTPGGIAAALESHGIPTEFDALKVDALKFDALKVDSERDAVLHRAPPRAFRNT